MLDRFVLWQGYHHRWRYNHRVNRLGSWVRHDADGRAFVGHSGASGTGPDQLVYADFHTRVDADGVRATEAVLDLVVDSVEGSERPFLHAVSVPAPGPACVALLQGFDLVAAPRPGAPADADKLVALDLAVGAVVVEGGQARFSVGGALNVDCDSPECDGHPSSKLQDILADLLVPGVGPAVVVDMLRRKADVRTRYTLRLRVLVLGGAPDAVALGRPFTVRNHVAWGLRKELWFKDAGSTVGAAPLLHPDWPAAVLGLQGLHVRLRDLGGNVLDLGDSAVHLLELDQAVHGPLRIGTQARVIVDAFAKNWTTDMPPGAYKVRGDADFRTDVVLIELARPRSLVATAPSEGVLTWAAADAPPDAAVRETALT